MATAKITSKGQITLPKEIRTRLGIGLGDEVAFVEENGVYLLKKLEHLCSVTMMDFSGTKRV